MAVLFALVSIDYESVNIIAVYADRGRAEADARKAEADFARTDPLFNAWCKRRDDIIRQWRAEGRRFEALGGVMPMANAEIVSMLGPCPEQEGYPSCDVWEAENRLELQKAEQK